MVDDDVFDGDDEQERAVEELTVTEAAVTQRIVVPRAWGDASLLASAGRGSLLLFSFADMPHLLCWQLPDDQDVIVELVPDNDPRARQPTEAGGEEAETNLAVWVLPDDIDEERLRYPARWGRPTPVLDAWIDGGPLLLTFADGEHTLSWNLDEDMLLSLIADDSL